MKFLLTIFTVFICIFYNPSFRVLQNHPFTEVNYNPLITTFSNF